MPFRNPIYLDTDLLSNLADYFGVDLPEEKSVTRRATTGSGRGAGVDKVVTAKLESSKAEEVTETFSVSTRPVRLMNDLVDSMAHQQDLIDLDDDPEAALANGSIVQVTGVLQAAAANEVGAIMGRFLPLLVTQAAAGATEFEPTDAELAKLLLADSTESGPQLFDFDPDAPVEGRRCLVFLDPAYLYGSATLEDLEAEQTLVAHVDRLVKPDSEVNLDRYLMPGLPRAVRRAMGRDGLGEMVSGLDKVLGREIDPDELTVNGPALMLKPLAVF